MIEILVVGAGPSGLCAAKTLLQVSPSADVVILEARSGLGGVWSRERLYPTLRTNNLLGSLDFTDFPMDPARFGVRPGEHMSGGAMNAYYVAYAEHFGLARRIRFGARVVEVRRRGRGGGGGGWVVDVERTRTAAGDEKGGGVDGVEKETIECGKLVVATGTLNVPRMPDLPGLADFVAPYVHSVELGPQADALFGNAVERGRATSLEIATKPEGLVAGVRAHVTHDSGEQQKTICVIGASKSGYDAVYLACSRGHRVEWVVRRSGRGPHWVFPPYTYLGPFRAWRERLVTRRVFAFMSPWAMSDFSGLPWVRRFLHESGPGRLLTRAFWRLLHRDMVRDCGFRRDPALDILEPEHSSFWYGTASGTLNYEHDIHEFVRRGQVQVHRDDISHLSRRAVHLRSGTTLHVDALVAATGYTGAPTVSFSPASMHSGLGVPSDALDAAQRSFWASLDDDADATIGASFPRLLAGPPEEEARRHRRRRPGPHDEEAAPAASHHHHHHHQKQRGGHREAHATTPWRLYRGIAPPALAAQGDRSVVFVGMMSNLANSIRLEVQSLWAAAYLHDRLPNDANLAAGGGGGVEAAKRIFQDAALLQRFSRHRAPLGHGPLYPDLVFDQLAYWEVLLHDLGLETRRKGGLLRELFEPYTQDDYRGMVDDWVRQNRQV